MFAAHTLETSSQWRRNARKLSQEKLQHLQRKFQRITWCGCRDSRHWMTDILLNTSSTFSTRISFSNWTTTVGLHLQVRTSSTVKWLGTGYHATACGALWQSISVSISVAAPNCTRTNISSTSNALRVAFHAVKWSRAALVASNFPWTRNVQLRLAVFVLHNRRCAELLQTRHTKSRVRRYNASLDITQNISTTRTPIWPFVGFATEPTWQIETDDWLSKGQICIDKIMWLSHISWEGFSSKQKKRCIENTLFWTHSHMSTVAEDNANNDLPTLEIIKYYKIYTVIDFLNT